MSRLGFKMPGLGGVMTQYRPQPQPAATTDQPMRESDNSPRFLKFPRSTQSLTGFLDWVLNEICNSPRFNGHMVSTCRPYQTVMPSFFPAADDTLIVARIAIEEEVLLIHCCLSFFRESGTM